MCGRYSLAAPVDDVVEAFDVPTLTFDYAPRWNRAPGQACPVVAEDARGRRMGLLRWGLAPASMDRSGTGFVNARAETVARKPAFRDSFARRRCIVPADGFFEWAPDDGRKVPYWFHPPGGGVFGLAAIRAGATFAVLTAEANADVAPVHHRMPVVVPAGAVDLWLSADAVPGDLRPLLAPAPAGTFARHPVSLRVNRVEHDDAGLVKPLDEGPDGTGSG
ncbi:MAG: SOS response-associated peptidase [Longimicrobiales bacterium]